MKVIDVPTIALLATGVFAVPGSIAAQESVAVPPGWHIGRVRIQGSGPTAAGFRPARTGLHATREQRTTDRALTINRPFAPPFAANEPDPLEFGSMRYGDVRSFSPFPTITSGTQLPYGLDGVGGFGSDVGFSAGSDATVYDRGS